MVFPKRNQRNYSIAEFEQALTAQGLEVIGWRKVPVDSSIVGVIAAETSYVMQVL